MTTIYNIRGTNGSGKTTLARAFLGPYPVDLSEYDAPTTRDPSRKRRYPATVNDADVMLLGSYGNACGGMDAHPAGKGFAVPLAAMNYALGQVHGWNLTAIVCEGVLASGVYGSWHEWGQHIAQEGHTLAFVYLHTPAEECLRRIRERQRAAGKTPALPGTPDFDRMVDNVTGKWTGTMATRRKAISDGHVVYDILTVAEPDIMRQIMKQIVEGRGEDFRAR